MPDRVLIADDDHALREMMRLVLSKEGYAVTTASSAAELAARAGSEPFDLVVSDIYLGDGSAVELLTELRARQPATPIILVTAQGTVETAAAATAAGVFDYLAKPFPIELLVERVAAALGHRLGTAATLAEGPESMIVGSHPAIVEVYKAVARVASLPVPVLVSGATGTGKELVARALHRFGRNPTAPFVGVNCGAIPEGLLESELFGHRRGAFTGAVRDHAGAIESARGGTLFLDEVGELPPLLQVKLLRFLQEGEIQPVGADRPVAVATRVVAATHRDLAGGHGGEVRQDFYYRLSAYEIRLPPLAARASDIPALVACFVERTRDRLGLVRAEGASRETLELFARQPWPGNVRQLEHVVQRALIDLGSLGDARAVARFVEPVAPTASSGPAIGDDLTLEELERLHIAAVLARVGGHRTRAAAILGIERKSLYRKAERLGILLDQGDVAEE